MTKGVYVNLYRINKDTSAYLYIYRDEKDGVLVGQFQNFEYAGGVPLSYAELIKFRDDIDTAILKMKGVESQFIFQQYFGPLWKWAAVQYIKMNANDVESFCKFLQRVYDIETLKRCVK